MNETISERLAALRVQMKQSGLNAALIPQTDPHQSEYIADHWQVRRWLSGFGRHTCGDREPGIAVD